MSGRGKGAGLFFAGEMGAPLPEKVKGVLPGASILTI